MDYNISDINSAISDTNSAIFGNNSASDTNVISEDIQIRSASKKIHYLRKWQKEGLRTYLSKENHFITIAHQGNGKTLFSCACFIAEVLQLDISEYNLDEINYAFTHSKNKDKWFPVIFVPTQNILNNTIKVWNFLGVKIGSYINKELKEFKSITDIRNKEGIDGLIVTYAQVRHADNGFKHKGLWNENSLIKLLLNSKFSINCVAILDEIHHLTATAPETEAITDARYGHCNLTAKYMLCNHTLFHKIHGMTGTPNLGKDSRKRQKYIPFCEYNNQDEIKPDVYISKRKSINEGNIVCTDVYLHDWEFLKAKVTIKEIESNSIVDKTIINETDISNWHLKSINQRSATRHATQKLSNDPNTWEQLLILGKYHLDKTKKLYIKAKGIIFCPSVESALVVHLILIKNSVLVLGQKPKTENDINFQKSKNINNYLTQKENTKIDWLITCNALAEGFDYPDCKVAILYPSFDYLYHTKISQMAGRINRKIDGYEQVKATLISFDIEAISKLIEEDEKDYRVCKPLTISEAQQIIDDDATLAKIEDRKAKYFGDVTIEDFKLAASANLKTKVYSAWEPPKTILKKLNTNYIKKYWANWDLIRRFDVKELIDEDTGKPLFPPALPGVYLVINSKTLEWLYVGQTNNLEKRITDPNRFIESPNIIRLEGQGNVFINWVVLHKDIFKIESALIVQLRPKYNGFIPSVAPVSNQTKQSVETIFKQMHLLTEPHEV